MEGVRDGSRRAPSTGTLGSSVPATGLVSEAVTDSTRLAVSAGGCSEIGGTSAAGFESRLCS